jgi:hypothetical protein
MGTVATPTNPRMAKQLVDQADAAGDKAEVVRWRAEVMRP